MKRISKRFSKFSDAVTSLNIFMGPRTILRFSETYNEAVVKIINIILKLKQTNALYEFTIHQEGFSYSDSNVKTEFGIYELDNYYIAWVMIPVDADAPMGWVDDA